MGLNKEEMEAAAQKGRKRALEFVANARQNAEDERKAKEADKVNAILPEGELTTGVYNGGKWATKAEQKDTEVGIFRDGKWVKE